MNVMDFITYNIMAWAFRWEKSGGNSIYDLSVRDKALVPQTVLEKWVLNPKQKNG